MAKKPESLPADPTLEETKWILEPRQGQNVKIVIGIRPGTKLNRKLEEELERMATLLQDEEIQAMMRNGCTLINCQPLECPDLTMCMPVTTAPPPPPPPTCPQLA
jgi:hypothetical protein